MEREPVVSSLIRTIGYDAELSLLEIEFLNGRVYQYAPVPEELYQDLISAPSIGSAFTQRIRRGGIPCTQIS